MTLLILAMLGIGIWRWWGRLDPQRTGPDGRPQPVATADRAGTPESETEAALVPTLLEVPKLAAPGTYHPVDNTVVVELSEYAGYAGLIVANNGLEPTEDSFFFRNHGFKVRIALSEEESWSALNAGQIGASATTVDVLAVLGRQFNVVTPAQIGFSRGANGVVVRSDIRRINALRGKILATAQFTEADFFIRYLAQEAGLEVQMLPDLNARPDPARVNLVFAADGFAAGDLFLDDVRSGRNRLAGCVTWAPKTTEVAEKAGGQAQILATSINLLIIADMLVVNRGFAEQHPGMVAGLVHGLLEGNRLAREQPDAQLDTIGRAFGWDRQTTQAELAKVHLSNLPENLAFFTGAIDAAGSFGGIFQSAIFAYGSGLIKSPASSDRVVDLTALRQLETSGAFQEQKVQIAPIRSARPATIEGDPLLSKNIRFLFAPNSAALELNHAENLKNLEAIKNLLQVSPGSTILLRGHVDNSKVDDFRRTGGDSYVRQMALRAVELSKNRAAEIKRLLVERHQTDPRRIDTVGLGWEEPLGTDHEQNRRVEAQWFTLE
jgi:NitT/TauT family transport system substrate-binding protein